MEVQSSKGVKGHKKGQAKGRAKARKPHRDFPLFPHSSGRWAKQVLGKRHYFGPVAGDEDGQKALAKWLREKDDLLAGRKPRPSADDNAIGVWQLGQHFLTHKKSLLAAGEIGPRTFKEYQETAELLDKHLGSSRRVDDLGPDDFQSLRAAKRGLKIKPEPSTV